MDISILEIVTLSILGLIAGIINTLAGGGSNLTVPALMIFGMPPDVANATNRIGVILQAIVGTRGFKKYDKLPTNDFRSIIIPLLIGSIIGSLFASYAPQSLLKYLLLGAMITVTTIIVISPNIITPPIGTNPYRVVEKRNSWWWLLIAGFYGGFVQAGVGFILITTFTGILRYDLISSNGLKVLSTVFFTGTSLAIFIYNDQVQWLQGLILAIGTMTGAYIGVKIAINIKQNHLKWLLFIMTISASIAAIVI